MLGVTDYISRLIPRNPILLRVVEAGGKRKRDLFIRCGYLGLLVLLVCFSLIGGENSTNLAELAKTSDNLFRSMSYLQLGLVALLAPIFTAGAITQEKDAQTYDILLATPLTNGQIVLGSLLSRLFFIVALLISGIPIFSITQIFGGVAIWSIVLSFGVAAATAFVTGAMAMAIATFKVGTRRTIFSFYLFIVIYLVGLFLLDRVPYFWIPGRNNGSHISWFTPIHPFLALRTIFDPTYAPPELGALPTGLRRWPMGWALSNPVSFYISFMFFLSFALVMPSIALLRRMAQSTNSLKNSILQLLHISKGDRTQKPRTVWYNPIAWREAKTKGSAARSTFLRWGFTIAGLSGAILLVGLFASKGQPASYINATMYKPNSVNLTIFGKEAGTYPLDPQFALTYKGDPATPGSLGGRLAIVGPPTVARHPAIDAATGRVKTDASGAPLIQEYLTTLSVDEMPRRLSATDLRSWLTGAVIVEFAVILLIVTNAAASTVTREKEDGTLDLLLSTPITSRYYIWGKLRGLVSFVAPLAAIPVLSLAILIVYDFFRMLATPGTNFHWVVFPESVLILPGTLIMVTAFAAILGMQMSLRFRTTVWAVMCSIGIVAAVCFGLGFCGYSALNSHGMESAGTFFGAFSPFTLVTLLIDPQRNAQFAFDAGDTGGMRLMLFIFGWAASGLYAMIVWTMYKSMVKNFDMTIRKQSR